MIQVPRARGSDKCDRLRRKSLAFLANLFKLRKRNNSLAAGMRIDEEPATMQRSPRSENPGPGCGTAWLSNGKAMNNNGEESAAAGRATLSPTGDERLACRQAGPSPSHSILTLTPGRTRNIDQDMEALRLSREDNPYLQILASKESLIEPVEESESDDAILMSTEFDDTRPLTLTQIHEHLVRSPPPASWSRNSVFHFPHKQQDSPGSRSERSAHSRIASPRSKPSRDEQPKSEAATDIKDRYSHAFSRLNPTPIRSLSEVRRLHRSADDSVQLMSPE